MRNDMAKVIVERPRVRPFKSRKGRRCALEDMPTREGMRRAASLSGCFNFPASENSIEWLPKQAGIWIVQEGR
jgi:hypothetical protein